MHMKDINPVVNITSINVLIDLFRLILLELCEFSDYKKTSRMLLP